MLWERSVVPAAAETSSGSVVGAFCGSSNSRNSVRERCKSVLWLQQQQEQRPDALQEHSAALTASGSVAKTFCGSSSHRNSVQEHCRSVGSSSKLEKSEARSCLKPAIKRFARSSQYQFLIDESFLYTFFMVGCFARALYNF